MIAAALFALAGATTTPTPAAREPLAEGSWGGPHVTLTVTREGGQLDVDCAHGTLSQPIAPDADGRFEASGVYVRERPGPVRPADVAGEKARYVGRVMGDTMTLSIYPADSDREIERFTLDRGRLGRVVKCQ